jgi:nucleolar complex protein 3
LNAAFLKRREYSTVRIAAFLHLLCAVALHAPPCTAAPLLAFVRQLSQRYPSSLSQLMENEQDAITSGTYHPMVQDPEHSNPFATSAWELSLLQFHVHPQIANQASNAASLKPLQLPLEAPERVQNELLRNTSEFYIAHRRASKKHALCLTKQDKRQERFITPNKTAHYHLL